MSEASQRNLGTILAALGAILFSMKAVLLKLAYGYSITPEALLSLRMMFAAPFILFVANRENRNLPRLSLAEALSVVALGLIGYYAANLLDFAGLCRISVDL
jgi:drug/metabolite transporter (DMT)-like permease